MCIYSLMQMPWAVNEKSMEGNNELKEDENKNNKCSLCFPTAWISSSMYSLESLARRNKPPDAGNKKKSNSGHFDSARSISSFVLSFPSSNSTRDRSSHDINGNGAYVSPV